MPLKIAIDLSPACAAPTGIGRYIADLCQGLTEIGQPAHGVYRGHRGHPDETVLRSCQGYQRYDLLGGRIGFHLRLPGILRRHGATLYHATTTLGSPPRLACPIVTTIHDVYPALPEAEVPAAHRRQFCASLASLIAVSRMIICPTTAVANELRLVAQVTVPIRVIPHGVWLRSRPHVRPEHGPYVITQGAIEGRKGYHLLARAWLGSRPSLPWFHIGPVRHDPDGAIRLAMTKAGCRLLGYLAEDARITWLAGATALLQPSLHEGFGYAPFEAMALGIPVIARPIPAACELLADAVAWNEDDDAWAAKVTDLCGDTAARERLILAGHALVDRHPLRAMAEAHLGAYREASS